MVSGFPVDVECLPVPSVFSQLLRLKQNPIILRLMRVGHAAGYSLVSKIVWQGVAVIAIVALAVSIVLEVALVPTRIQYVTQSVTLTQAVTQQIGTTTNPNAYVLVRFEYVAYGHCPPSSTNPVPFGLHLDVENHGYDRVYVDPAKFYVVINNQVQYQHSPSAVAAFASCYGRPELEATYVFNGLVVAGDLFFQIPISRGFGVYPWTLIWDHPSDLNVRYACSSDEPSAPCAT